MFAQPRICKCGRIIRPTFHDVGRCEDCWSVAQHYVEMFRPRRAQIERTSDDYQKTEWSKSQ